MTVLTDPSAGAGMALRTLAEAGAEEEITIPAIREEALMTEEAPVEVIITMAKGAAVTVKTTDAAEVVVEETLKVVEILETEEEITTEIMPLRVVVAAVTAERETAVSISTAAARVLNALETETIAMMTMTMSPDTV